MSAASEAAGTRSSLVLGRACGGALIFGVPLLMTEEMWELATRISPVQLAVYWLVGLPLLIGLSRYFGFEKTDTLVDDIVDAFAAITLGTGIAAAVLALLHVLDLESPWTAMNQIALQALPCSIGALLAQSQLRDDPSEPKDDGPPDGYPGALFPMIVGALYLGLAIAPTEEVATIAGRMDLFGLAALVGVTLAVNEAFATAAAREAPADTPGSTLTGFLVFTVIGYVVAAALAAYLLWIANRLDGGSVHAAVAQVIVLGFPMSIGATAARVIL